MEESYIFLAYSQLHKYIHLNIVNPKTTEFDSEECRAYIKHILNVWYEECRRNLLSALMP